MGSHPMTRTLWALLLLLAACSGPVSAPPAPTGEMIAFGAISAREACFTCHGAAGEGAGAVPRIAGLDAGYAVKQLEDYARELRADAVMSPIARRLTAADRRAVAYFYEALGRQPTPSAPAPPLYHAGDPARGLIACARCHEGEGAAAAPRLGGQPAAYTIEQLDRWRRGVRRNDPNDMMGRAARPLTDAEIQALARYLEANR